MIKPYALLKKSIQPSSLKIELITCSLQVEPFQKDLDQIWKNLKEKAEREGRELWDGTYYRLENVSGVAAGSEILMLSSIKYSTVRSLFEYGRTRQLDPRFYSHHINTGSLIRTRDDQYVFGVKKRAGGSRFFDLVGGGLQSSELVVNSGRDIAENMLKEIQEEINLSAADLLRYEIVGFIVASNTSVIIVFHAETSLSYAEVKEVFERRSDLELDELVGVSAGDVTKFLQEQTGYFPVLSQLILP